MVDQMALVNTLQSASLLLCQYSQIGSSHHQEPLELNDDEHWYVWFFHGTGVLSEHRALWLLQCKAGICFGSSKSVRIRVSQMASLESSLAEI
jgi:hypothetical protein